MSDHRFDTRDVPQIPFDERPTRIPVLPRTGATQLPAAVLPPGDGNPCPHPPVMETTLEFLRKTALPSDNDQIKKFIGDTAELPGDCIVRLSNGRVALLADDEGRLLSFA